jgi:hypothetical protein
MLLATHTTCARVCFSSRGHRDRKWWLQHLLSLLHELYFSNCGRGLLGTEGDRRSFWANIRMANTMDGEHSKARSRQQVTIPGAARRRC